LNNHTVGSLTSLENNIFAGTDIGVYLSTNDGTSWSQQNEGFTNNIIILSICIFNNYIIVGAENSGIWRRYLPELIGIQPISKDIPNSFFLSQNYPNPFNPTTKIKFAIPVLPLTKGEAEGVNTKLIIYDILGREVATILNQSLQPGTYEVEWDASNYPSGVYFYKLTARDFTETKKLVLIK
jgi:hypothetical protein